MLASPILARKVDHFRPICRIPVCQATECLATFGVATLFIKIAPAQPTVTCFDQRLYDVVLYLGQNSFPLASYLGLLTLAIENDVPALADRRPSAALITFTVVGILVGGCHGE